MPFRILLAAIAAALMLAAPAQAAKPKLPKTATFKATLSGNQVSTWSYRDADEPLDPCDGASAGDGSQSISFKTKTVRITAFKTGGETMLGPIMLGRATIDREGDYAVAPSTYIEELCGPAVDGGGGPVDGLDKDCGERVAPMTFDFSFDAVPDSDADGITPLAPKGSLFLGGDIGAWLGYIECPWWIGGGDGPGDASLLQSWEPVNVKRLFDKRRKTIVISGDRRASYPTGGFTGDTLITWNLRLRRVG